MQAFIQRKAKLLMYARGRVSFARLLRAPPSSFLRASPSSSSRSPHIPRHLRGRAATPPAQWRLGARRHLDDGGPVPTTGLRAPTASCEVRDGCYRRPPVLGGRARRRCGAAGRWSARISGRRGAGRPEEGAGARSHLHGTVLRVADRVDVSGWDGAPRQRPTFNLSAAARAPAGAGVVRCLSEAGPRAQRARRRRPSPPMRRALRLPPRPARVGPRRRHRAAGSSAGRGARHRPSPGAAPRR